jgi:hypothetical protein
MFRKPRGMVSVEPAGRRKSGALIGKRLAANLGWPRVFEVFSSECLRKHLKGDSRARNAALPECRAQRGGHLRRWQLAEAHRVHDDGHAPTSSHPVLYNRVCGDLASFLTIRPAGSDIGR